MTRYDNEGSSSEGNVSSFNWDQACDLLGGAEWEEAVQHWKHQGLDAQKESQLLNHSARFSNQHQFLRGKDPSSCTELLWLKWSLFIELCRTVKQFHDIEGRPNLCISPGDVECTFRDREFPWLPVRWVFSVKLATHTQSPPCLDESIPEEMKKSLRPVSDRQPLYQSPVIREWSLGRQEPTRLLIRSLDQIQEEFDHDIRGLARIHVISNTLSDVEFSEKDVFHLSFLLPGRESAQVQVWARKVDKVERGIVVTGASLPMSQDDWNALSETKDHVMEDASVTIYRAYPESCDLYSLGIMLVRALLVNQHQPLAAVCQVLKDVMVRLEPMVNGVDGDDVNTLLGRIPQLLNEFPGVFSPSAAVFSEQQYSHSSEDMPRDQWNEMLIFMLRLLSSVPGFSFAEEQTTGIGRNTQTGIDAVLATGESLGRRLQNNLLATEHHHISIPNICQRLKSEFVGSH